MKHIAPLLFAFAFAAAAHAADKPATVRIAPVPGVSFSLPHTWIACDSDTNKLLGNNADPHNLVSKVCGSNPNVPYKFRGFNAILFRTMSMMIDQHEKQDIAAADLDAMTPEVIKAILPQACDGVTKPLTADGTIIQSCDMNIETFAGHKALHSVVTALPPDNKNTSRYQIDIYELPYSKGYLQVQFNSPLLFKSVTGADKDAIIASFAVE